MGQSRDPYITLTQINPRVSRCEQYTHMVNYCIFIQLILTHIMCCPFGPIRWERVEYQFTDVQLELLKIGQATRVDFCGMIKSIIDGLR